MKQIRKAVLAAVLAGTVSIAPAAGFMPVTTVFAHGHHGGCHQGTVSTHYYYCGGHSAHTHHNGVCPYADDYGYDDDYYYCGGHSAHTHHNGVCPYAYYVSSNTVKRVQKVLNRCGYSCGTADGVMGTKTKRALKRFQRDNDLKADGVIGEQTLTALGL